MEGHGANLAAQCAGAQVPELIRPALAGIGGWERLQRFAAAARHPTLAVAEGQPKQPSSGNSMESSFPAPKAAAQWNSLRTAHEYGVGSGIQGTGWGLGG